MCRSAHIQIVQKARTVYSMHAQWYDCRTQIVREAAPLMTRMAIREETACKNSGKGRTLYDTHGQWGESRAEIVLGRRTVHYKPQQYRAEFTQVVGGRTCRICTANGVRGTHQSSCKAVICMIRIANLSRRLADFVTHTINRAYFIFSSILLKSAPDMRLRQYCEAQFCTNGTSYAAHYLESAFLSRRFHC